ncbi:MAG: isochorismatase family protein [Rhodopirellula sp.]|nr:isochorismatase family protein [Rhodopirellula sp.]
MRSIVPWIFFGSLILPGTLASAADADGTVLRLQMRSREKAPEDGDLYRIVYKTVEWDPKKTAIIICDMWDTLCCKIPADRVAEIAPRMNEFVAAARQRGVLIIHAPSGNVDFYDGTPARKRALDAPKVGNKVPLKWNDLDPEREPPLPIDDSDGGWEGPRLAGRPQTRQIASIEIKDVDAVDAGPQIYYLLQQRGIENVMLMGVHTNMCVLGRPFGIRQMVYLGKNAVLVRDLTDSLYNPQRWPQVSHFQGTERVIEHIEKFWCPTITSTDLLDKPAFRFEGDKRPRVAIVVSDDHYHADKTLPLFAQMLRDRYGCDCAVLHGEGEADIRHTAELQTADCLVLYVRRLALPKKQLDRIRAYVASGRPVVALRTASHAFAARSTYPEGYQSPDGCDEWPGFDAEVLGGNYHGHGPNQLGSDVAMVPEQARHPILAGLSPQTWHSTGSLYYTAPLKEDALVLMNGSAGNRTEPLTWFRTHQAGRVTYTGLGHPEDFKQPEFCKLLVNMIFWSMDRPVPQPDTIPPRPQNLGDDKAIK